MKDKSTNKKIVIFHIITGLNTAGAEMMLFKLLKGSDDSLFESIVISLLGRSSMGEEFDKINKRVITLEWSKWHRLLAAPFSIAGLLLKYKPDIIQGWMYHGNLLASCMAFFNRKKPLVWNIRHTIDDLNEEKTQIRLLIKLGARLSRRPGRIIYNSRVSLHKHTEIGYARDNCRLIPNGFEVNTFKPADNKKELRKAYHLPENVIVIGHVARYHPMKDHASFIGACIKMAKKHENLCFMLAGREVDCNSKLAEQIENSGFKHLFYRLGEQKELAKIYNLFDIFVISSAWGEAFPNVLGEAMACAVPAIVTDVGDSADIVGNTGFVVPPKNVPELAMAMDKLLLMPLNQRKELGNLARQRITENFELSKIVRQYQDLYLSLLNVRG